MTIIIAHWQWCIVDSVSSGQGYSPDAGIIISSEEHEKFTSEFLLLQTIYPDAGIPAT